KDVRYDMHVNIVTFQPGGTITFPETHVMEHGLFVLSGKAMYLLNTDWVEVEAGDFMWLRAFCPQACYAGGPEPFRYLLDKDVKRHADLLLYVSQNQYACRLHKQPPAERTPGAADFSNRESAVLRSAIAGSWASLIRASRRIASPVST